MSKFGTFLIGYIIFTLGVALGMHLLGVPPMWTGVAVLILIGVGVFSGAAKAKRDDPPPA
jgi:uncharacterized membrane protein